MITLEYVDENVSSAFVSIILEKSNNLDLSHRDLHRALFFDLTISDSNLCNTELRSADFTHAKFLNCNFSKSGLINIYSKKAHFENCCFDGARFYAITLIDSVFINCTFINIKTDKFKLVRCNLTRKDFDDNAVKNIQFCEFD